MKNSLSPALGLLLLRAAVGIVFVAHGWQKLVTNGVAATQAMFTGLGVPFADVVGPAIGILEIAGGVALVLGVATRVFSILLAATSVGAIATVHASNGFYVAEGGYEFVLLLAVAAVALALVGPGRLSLDAVTRGGRRRGARSAARAQAA